MSIKITGDAGKKKYICIKTKHTHTNNKSRINKTHTYKKKKNKQTSLSSNQIIGLDGESKSNESGFCCC